MIGWTFFGPTLPFYVSSGPLNNMKNNIYNTSFIYVLVNVEIDMKLVHVN